MNSIELLIKQAIIRAFAGIQLSLDEADVVLELSKDAQFGDYASNVCLKYAKSLKQSPLRLAQLIMPLIQDPSVEKIEVAGPGFLNFFLKADIFSDVIQEILLLKDRYGLSNVGQGKRINLEFVSANPTGPMHVAHARAAGLGDVIANLLTMVGYRVTREFYVNDAGGQIHQLARSIYLRYRELLGDEITLPEDGYFGKDIIEIAKTILAQEGPRFSAFDEPFFKAVGLTTQLTRIKEDLSAMGITFDAYRSEQAIRDEGTIAKTLERLAAYTYMDQGATYLKTTAFGDDKDRVIIKSDGQFTYFLPDIAYHLDKLSRQHEQLIDILGPDHHGYIGRMQAALTMLGYPEHTLQVLVMQLVTLTQDGQEVKMSKRTGVGITMRELVEEVGKDAARYFIAARSYHNPLEFDLALAKTKTNVNPLYYAQYAHARLTSLLMTGQSLGVDPSGKGLTTPEERDLLKHLRAFPQTVIQAAHLREPSIIAQYLQHLASYTHSFYTIRRVIDQDQVAISQSRLALVHASQQVIRNSLAVFGIIALDQM
jgi:arginyl-tRNA synthetase